MRPSYLNLPYKSKNEKVELFTHGVRVPRQVPRHPGLTMIDYYAERERQANAWRAVKQGFIVLVIITLTVCMMVL